MMVASLSRKESKVRGFVESHINKLANEADSMVNAKLLFRFSSTQFVRSVFVEVLLPHSLHVLRRLR